MRTEDRALCSVPGHCHGKTDGMGICMRKTNRPVVESQAGGQFSGLVMQAQLRAATAVTHNFHIGPPDVADACAQRLGYRFLDSKTAGEAGSMAGAICLLLRRKKAPQEAFAMPGHCPLNTRYFDEIYSHC